jgi:hypothetical protein
LQRMLKKFTLAAILACFAVLLPHGIVKADSFSNMPPQSVFASVYQPQIQGGPVISSVTPTESLNDQNFTLTISGSGFGANSQQGTIYLSNGTNNASVNYNNNYYSGHNLGFEISSWSDSSITLQYKVSAYEIYLMPWSKLQIQFVDLNGRRSSSANVQINGHISSVQLQPQQTSVQVGESTNLNVTTIDASNTTVSGYNVSLKATSLSGEARLSSSSVTTGIDGAATVSLTDPTSEDVTITATYTSGWGGYDSNAYTRTANATISFLSSNQVVPNNPVVTPNPTPAPNTPVTPSVPQNPAPNASATQGSLKLSASSLNFLVGSNLSVPQPQQLQISGTAPASIQVSTDSPWIKVQPNSSQTLPINLAVSIDSSSFTYGSYYNGNIYLQSSDGSVNLSVPVKVVVQSNMPKQTTYTSTPFSDIPDGFWATQAIATLANAKIVDGLPNGSFQPNQMVKRGQWAKLLVSAFNLSSTQNQKQFTDVSTDRWDYNYIETTSSLMPAYSDGSFRPEVSATRQDATASLVMAMGWGNDQYDPSVLNIFSDQDKISPGIKKYVAIAVSHGLIQGFSDGTFGPQQSLTRAQSAQIIYGAQQNASNEVLK